jgi:DNA-binding response OmpR family regulator
MLKKILIIDDDPGIHMITVPILANLGYTVISAKNGEQGFQLALNERPDLIILDVIMPGIKGRDLCLKIKSYDVLKNIPIVFLTAKDSTEDVQAEMNAGGVAHLTKPIQPTELTSTVKNIIG